jgi:transposase-like protein
MRDKKSLIDKIVESSGMRNPTECPRCGVNYTWILTNYNSKKSYYCCSECDAKWQYE